MAPLSSTQQSIIGLGAGGLFGKRIFALRDGAHQPGAQSLRGRIGGRGFGRGLLAGGGAIGLGAERFRHGIGGIVRTAVENIRAGR